MQTVTRAGQQIDIHREVDIKRLAAGDYRPNDGKLIREWAWARDVDNNGKTSLYEAWAGDVPEDLGGMDDHYEERCIDEAFVKAMSRGKVGDMFRRLGGKVGFWLESLAVNRIAKKHGRTTLTATDKDLLWKDRSQGSTPK